MYWMDAIWIIAIASLVGISGAIVGAFLVLRRMSMLGDAISHSVLFGIVAAFLLTSSRSVPVMLIGAGLVGLLTAWLTDFLHRRGQLQEDASIGVVFTWLFALGVILIAAFAGQVDLDQECVLYGEIAFAPFDTWVVGGQDIGPRAFWILLGVTALNFLMLAVGHRPLKTVAFSPAFAASIGISVTFWHYLLMSMVSLTTVASFDAVGAILVVAMIVVPANTAFMVSKSLKGMLVGAMGVAVASAVLGYFLAAWLNGSIAAAVAMVAGGFFVVTLLFVGRDSVLARARQRRRQRQQAATPAA